MKLDAMSKEKETVMRVSEISIAVNIILSLFKLAAGIFSSSGAMVADAAHSASDVLTTFIVIAGFNISSKAADKEHPYGHERMECVAALILAVILFLTGLGIGYFGVKKMIFGGDTLKMPGRLSLFAAVVSIAVKEWMYHFTMKAANKINSGALKADAWHHRTDAMSSVGALIGIFGARAGFLSLDPLAAVVICLFIIAAAYGIFKDSLDKMVDKSCDDETLENMYSIISGINGVQGINILKSRMFGSKMYVDTEIEVNGFITLYEAHEIAENVHKSIENNFPAVKHCMVHVNPSDKNIRS